jgi:NAD(P)-dependent dehydrogenase (short-subunit alcohol dehydrogenase family)
MKKALITGITGQDGSYLADLLLNRGYEVHGIVRRVAFEDPRNHLWRLRHVLDRIKLHPASLESFASIFRVMDAVQPDECYHLAAQSFVSYSFEDEFSTINTNINGTHHVLASLKERAPRCRFYFAGSSEMFGKVRTVPQDESTAFHPRSPYGISKVAGFDLTRNYREAYGHIIGEAMSVGAVVVTTDAAPMNELVTRERGVLVRVARSEPMRRSTRNFVEIASLETELNRIFAMSVAERAALGRNARAWYEAQDMGFQSALGEFLRSLPRRNS